MHLYYISTPVALQAVIGLEYCYSGCSLVGKAPGWGEDCLWQSARKSSLENWFSKMKFWVRAACGGSQGLLTDLILVLSKSKLGSLKVTAERDPETPDIDRL